MHPRVAYRPLWGLKGGSEQKMASEFPFYISNFADPLPSPLLQTPSSFLFIIDIQ